MKKSTHLRLVLSSALVALGLWSIPAAQAQACTREYAPVCGQVAGQMPQTFANRCTLDNAKARPIAQGECPHTATPPTQPMLGSDSDAKGCKASAGYSWHAELASCIRPWMTSAITLEVAAHRQKCPGQTDTKCLMVRELQDTVSRLEGTVRYITARYEKLSHEMAVLKRTTYGKKSERLGGNLVGEQAKLALRLETLDGVVTSIYWGRPDAVELIEGCA